MKTSRDPQCRPRDPGDHRAFIFIAAVTVEPLTLISMIVAAVLGAWVGAGVVARLPRRQVQLGMGMTLMIAAALMFMTNLSWMPGGGEATGLRARACSSQLPPIFFSGR